MPAVPDVRTRASTWLEVVGVLVIVAACVARLATLDADPYFRNWIGYVTDEGRWVETARNVALFRDPGLYGLSRLHLLLSPAFQALTWVIFKLAGIGFWSARLIPAIAGAALVVSLLPLRRHVSPVALVVGAVVLGFEPSMLSVSRVAIPEMPALLFSLLAFLALVFGRHPLRSGLAGGLLLAIAIGMKATTLLVLPAFTLVAWCAGRQRTVRDRLTTAGALLACVMASGAAAVGGAVLVGAVNPHSLVDVVGLLGRFLRGGGVFVPLDRFFHVEYMVIDALLLAAWCASWAWVVREEWRDSPVGRLYVLSGLWALCWFIAWLPLAYVPERYLVHATLPLTLHAMAGLTLLGNGRLSRVAARIGEPGANPIWPRALWLVLPAAIAIAPLAAGAISLATGLVTERLSVRLVVIAALTVLFAVVVRRRLARGPAVPLFGFGAPLAFLLWAAARAVGGVNGFWPQGSSRDMAVHALLVAAAFTLTWMTTRRRLDPPGEVRILFVPPALLLAAWLAAVQGPLLLHPTHLERDQSRALGQLLGGHRGSIRTSNASSLFLETRLRYVDELTPLQRPDVIVRFFPDADWIAPPGPGYRLVARYPMPVHPNYERRLDRAIDVGVYERIAAPALSATPAPG